MGDLHWTGDRWIEWDGAEWRSANPQPAPPSSSSSETSEPHLEPKWTGTAWHVWTGVRWKRAWPQPPPPKQTEALDDPDPERVLRRMRSLRANRPTPQSAHGAPSATCRPESDRMTEPMAEEDLKDYEAEREIIISESEMSHLHSAGRGSAVGWYPDPLTSNTARYWSGYSWTARIRRSKHGVPQPKHKPMTKPNAKAAMADPAAPTPAGPLTECSDCGGTVSRRAATCIHCGAPLRTASTSPEEEAWRTASISELRSQSRYLRSFWWVLLIFLVLNLIAAIVDVITSSASLNRGRF